MINEEILGPIIKSKKNFILDKKKKLNYKLTSL